MDKDDKWYYCFIKNGAKIRKSGKYVSAKTILLARVKYASNRQLPNAIDIGAKEVKLSEIYLRTIKPEHLVL